MIGGERGMKIGDMLQPFVDQTGRREEKQSVGADRPHFQEMLSLHANRLHKEELDGIMRQIDEIGRELAKRCTWRLLMNYKERIRKFLEIVVKNSYQTKERQGFDQRGRVKIYKLISQIERRLADLAEEVMQQEVDHLKILEKIGDIRGLLLNLYF
jgi:uncharacterized protein